MDYVINSVAKKKLERCETINLAEMNQTSMDNYYFEQLKVL